MPDATLTVRADDPIGTISPRLYGHFADLSRGRTTLLVVLAGENGGER